MDINTLLSALNRGVASTNPSSLAKVSAAPTEPPDNLAKVTRSLSSISGKRARHGVVGSRLEDGCELEVRPWIAIAGHVHAAYLQSTQR